MYMRRCSNQLCDCDLDLWFNGECDESCNTTECAYDFYQCAVDTVNENETCYEYIDNQSSIVCYSSWIGDTWCDANCRTSSECEYDDEDCLACSHSCDDVYKLVITYVAAISPPDELITIDEACHETVTVILEQKMQGFTNCTHQFEKFDLNNNGYVGMLEALIGLADFFGLDDETKLNQIDCTNCVSNQSLYYY